MNHTEVVTDALTLKESNPFFVKYLKKKSDLIETYNRKEQKKAKKRAWVARTFHLNTSDKDKYSYDRGNWALENGLLDKNNDEYFFLCFMTKKYFRDNTLISLAKIVFGVAAIFCAVWMEEHFNANALKSPIMVAAFGYGLIMTPLAILYTICNFICYTHSDNFVTTTKSRLAQKIIIFFDPETDKFMAVNFKNLLGIGQSFREKRRIRGW
ncbi:MAG: hypothetical protein MJ188_03375 [Treponema sp.]|nr:hypothetical protein [Treponema sp.]